MTIFATTTTTSLLLLLLLNGFTRAFIIGNNKKQDDSFSSIFLTSSTTTRSLDSSSVVLLFSSTEDNDNDDGIIDVDNENDNDESNDTNELLEYQRPDLLDNFNPLDRTKNERSTLSFRSYEMTELLDKLRGKSSKEEINKLLRSKREFLLQPLESDELEPESIYTLDMTRDERYDLYETTMQERIAKSSNRSKVKLILTAMMEYVLSQR